MNDTARGGAGRAVALATADAAAQPASERHIVDRIFLAVTGHRLPAGTKLPENVLCEVFGASRARVRRALLMLAERGIVELHSNRGAFIASPSPEEARDVFQARRAVEPTIVRNAVDRLTEAHVAALARHVDRELAARRGTKRHEAIRLSGEFHVKLAQFAGNAVLARFLGELVARSSLIIGLFGSPRISLCAEDEHRRIIDAIADRDAARATDLMLDHLHHIEGELELAGRGAGAIDLRRVLSAAHHSTGRRRRGLVLPPAP
ncbi:MAG: GntR family transcriptional regulator [Rhodospirillaceae bacterium]|nr:GntR family transcriptional regulator [Rhodospirillaceae bacterium]